MDVNGHIALYTTLFGWHFYDVIWTVLAGTGLAYLPILGAIFDGFMQSRSSGSVMSADAESALSLIEVDIFKIFLVMVLAVIPTGLTSISSDSLNYGTYSTGDTDSTYDDSFGVDPLIAATDVQVPAWWYWTMAISQGMTKAVVVAAGDGNVYRDLELAISTAAIRDPSTRYQLQVFNNECHIPARSQYYREASVSVPTGTVTPPAADDIHWVGSSFLINTAGYYDSINTRTVLPGYAYNAVSMPEFDGDPNLGGRPTCSDLWGNLSDLIYSEAERDGVPTRWEVVTGGISATERSAIIKRYIQTERFDILQNADEINSIRNQGNGFVQQGLDMVGGLASNVGLAKQVFALRGAVNSVVYGGEIVQSYILMVLYMFIPIAMLASRYSFGFLVSGSLIIFMVIFWTALWAIAAQADFLLTRALWGDGFWDNIANFTDPENATKSLVHSVVVLGLYIFLPTVSTWMLAAAGLRATSTLAHGMQGNAASQIAGSTASGGATSRAAVRNVYNGSKAVASASAKAIK